MSEVKRYYTCGFDSLSNRPSDIRQSKALVLAVDFDAEHALRLEAERQVGELREQLEDSVSMLTRQGAKLDTAMGLLRRASRTAQGRGAAGLKSDIDAFLNTTSTEGKDDTTAAEESEDGKKVFVRDNTKMGQRISMADMQARYTEGKGHE